MYFIGAAICFVLGLYFGIHFVLLDQAVLLVGFILLMNSWFIRKYEIGALIPMFAGVIFFIGVAIGDISFMFQTDIIDINISNPFTVD